jgi:hypothetical protein
MTPDPERREFLKRAVATGCFAALSACLGYVGDEAPADAWRWFTAAELDDHDGLADDVRELDRRAIAALS